MADIDKGLPNTRTQVELPGAEDTEVQISEEQKEQQPVEVIPDEDGGATVDFDPSAVNQPSTESHFDNLSDILPDDVLDPIGSTLKNNYMDYKMSRKEWEKTYTEGLDLLGFKYENRNEPFQGASGATHPVLAEAVTQFQSMAYKELLPSDGPVRTQVLGVVNPQKEQQAQRVKDFMNYQIMDQMQEYEPEFDQMLFHLPLAGSAFKKVYYDDLLGRAVSKFVPADDLIVPYTATSLDDAEAIIHTVKISENDLRKQQVAGFYSDIELSTPAVVEDKLRAKEKELEGTTKTGKPDDMYTLLECHVNLDLEGFEDNGPDGKPTGIKLPYIVTIEEGTTKVLSIRRNYAAEDAKKKKIQYFVHFKFLPGLGFYGFGLIHMIGGLSRTATTALRQLLDAGTLANLPAGFKTRGVAIGDQLSKGIQATEAVAGVARNPHLAVLYETPNFRAFNFSWELRPKDFIESLSINRIIRFFKYYSSPGFANSSKFGNNIFEYPSQFSIKTKYDELTHTYGDCVLKNFSVDYHGEGTPLYYDASNQTGFADKKMKAPAVVKISCDFQEVTIVTRETIEGANR